MTLSWCLMSFRRLEATRLAATAMWVMALIMERPQWTSMQIAYERRYRR
jgi:hypothetical protein